jgi:catechol 2,3-dioxygenase-like lactoylglutathione lyase family enzyme
MMGATFEDSRERLFCGVHHVQLSVAALERSAAFYHAIGLSRTDDLPGLRVTGLEGEWFRGSNVALRLTNSLDSLGLQRHDVNTPGITHLCMQTTEITALFERFGAAGASFHCDLTDLGTGFLYAYARDHEHNVIELEGVPRVVDDTDPWIAHVNIATLKIDRLADFYAGLFYGSPTRSPRFHDNPKLDAIANLSGVSLRMAWVNAENAQIEFSEYSSPRSHTMRNASAPGYGCIAFQVTNIAAAMARVVDLGGRAVAQDAAYPHLARCEDPDGNTILLLDLSAEHFAASRIESFPDSTIARRFADARSNSKMNV